MLMALSAEAVANSVMSGENLTHVIPRACARGIVVRGTKLSDFFLTRAVSSRGGVADASLDRDRVRDRSGEEV
jgi:hypothetical protein